MLNKYEIVNQFDAQERIVVEQNDTLTSLKKLPDNFFKLAVSSPPYNIGKEYEKQVKLQNYLDWQTEILSELVRVTSENGSIVGYFSPHLPT